MTRRTFDDWKYLVDKQTASGLSVPKFCSQHNLNPKYFYSRKSMISTKSNEGKSRVVEIVCVVEIVQRADEGEVGGRSVQGLGRAMVTVQAHYRLEQFSSRGSSSER